ncbi:MAG: hypothetical protein L0227_07200 [Chloroflexi bacterium]|nr:hypothetical protein [Chloroflexota bacterium]
MRIFFSTLRKLVRRPVTFVTFGLLVALLALILLAVGATAGREEAGPGAAQALLIVTFPGAYSLILSFILGFGGLFAVIFAAAIAGSEWSWGMLKSAVARGESRSRYQLATFAAIALMIGVGLVASMVIGVGLGVLSANTAGISTDGLDDSETLGQLPELLARAWLAIVEAGALGFAIATLARSQLAGIGAGIGSFFGEQFASIFLPDIVKYLPFNAGQAVVATPGEFGGSPSNLAPDTALFVVLAWLIGALMVATIYSERAEISG